MTFAKGYVGHPWPKTHTGNLCPDLENRAELFTSSHQVSGHSILDSSHFTARSPGYCGGPFTLWGHPSLDHSFAHTSVDSPIHPMHPPIYTSTHPSFDPSPYPFVGQTFGVLNPLVFVPRGAHCLLAK